MNSDARKSDLLDMTVRLLTTTERAALVDPVYVDRKPVWIALSQAEFAQCSDPRHHTMTLPEWLALENGLL